MLPTLKHPVKSPLRHAALRLLLLALLAPLGCTKAEGSAPAPTASASAASTSASNPPDAKPSPRVLALQNPGGQAPVDREIELLSRRIEKSPDLIDPWIFLGRAWIKKARSTADPGFYLNADACAEVVLDREPKNRLARNLRAMVLLENHAFADAKDLAELILKEDPDDIFALGTKSDAELELGDFKAALASAQKLVDLKPNLPSYARSAHLRWLQGDSASAKKMYRSAIDARDPRDAEPYAWVLVQVAMVFWHEGDIEGADAGFDKALEAHADDPAALLGKARVALAKGDAKRAAELGERAFAKSPLCEAAWLLGDAKKAAGDEKGAEEAFALAVKQGRSSDRRTLSLFFSAKQKEPDEALSLARAEAKIRREIHTLDALAWALYRKGELEEAKKQIEEARALGTKEPALLFHEGAIRVALAAKEKDEKAKKEGEQLLRKALEMNPHFDLDGAREAKKLLGEAP